MILAFNSASGQGQSTVLSLASGSSAETLIRERTGTFAVAGRVSRRLRVEILRLLAQGLTNRQIAKQLVISPGTVKVHVGHIIAKLGVSDRTQAAVKAIELGIVPQTG